MYPTTHWKLWVLAPQKEEIKELKRISGTGSGTEAGKRFDQVADNAEQAQIGTTEVMKKLEMFRATGLIALILSIVAVFRMKSFVRFNPLPFGLFSGYLTLTIM